MTQEENVRIMISFLIENTRLSVFLTFFVVSGRLRTTWNTSCSSPSSSTPPVLFHLSVMNSFPFIWPFGSSCSSHCIIFPKNLWIFWLLFWTYSCCLWSPVQSAFLFMVPCILLTTSCSIFENYYTNFFVMYSKLFWIGIM